MEKVTVCVSACLLGINCKYNGSNNYNEKLSEFLKDKNVVPVCPEVLGGLKTPRAPCEIQNGVVVNKLGKNVDKEFRAGAKKALQTVLDSKADYVILQPRSPSCGVNEVYNGTFSKKLITGSGIFAQLLKKSNIKAYEPDDLLKWIESVIARN